MNLSGIIKKLRGAMRELKQTQSENKREKLTGE